MTATTFSKSTRIERPADEVAAWLARPGITMRLMPPWVTQDQQTLFADLANKLTCHIEPDGHDTCVLTEETPPPANAPLPPPGALARLLAYRHAVIRDDIELTARHGAVRRLRIAVAGASGMIGRALATFLQTQGHEVVPLKRDTAAGTYDPAALAKNLHGIDALINLAGAGIAAQKWTRPQRDLIWESRAGTTRALIAALAKIKHRPFALINASATGFYGARGDDLLDETAPRPPAGDSFLADVCAGWEHEASAASTELGMRAAFLRFGIVLSPAGGALAAMLPYFQKNLGAKLGHGRQWMSWTGIDDAVAAIYHAILTHTCEGPVNIVSPNPVANAEFTETLARALGKKTAPGMPRWLLRLRYGIDFANETMLASTRVDPAKLRASGYVFRHATLASALEHLLL